MENTITAHTTPTEIETRWMAAKDRFDANNPILAILGPNPMGIVETLALRSELRQRGLTLTMDHTASSYGIPVAVDRDGNAYGPGDVLPLRRQNWKGF